MNSCIGNNIIINFFLIIYRQLLNYRNTIFRLMKMLAFVTSFRKFLYIAYSVKYRNNIFLREVINALRALAQLNIAFIIKQLTF